ncbi:MAG: hypothetical protein H0T62_02775 [Parachlamydiaceae bacterium]|nr:hypothetical protein [Parachlamydiaceae bacterium]
MSISLNASFCSQQTMTHAEWVNFKSKIGNDESGEWTLLNKQIRRIPNIGAANNYL